MNLSIIIPALDEEEAIASVVNDFLAVQPVSWKLNKIIVVDNGSLDQTASVAKKAGATVVHEQVKGYGAACLRGIEELTDEELVCIADGDGSDLPEELNLLVDSLIREKADLVVGSRIKSSVADRILPFHQQLGNIMVSCLIGWKYGVKLTDLGPFRVIRKQALQEISMTDKGFGWNVEMHMKMLQHGYKVIEVPVTCRKRIAGNSKISGTVKGSIMAAIVILSVFTKHLLFDNRKTI